MIAIQLTPGGAFTDLAEMGDVTPPEMSRNEFDATTQNEDIDSYVLGVLRRGPFQVPLNWIPDEETHDHLTGVYALMFSAVITGFRVRFPQVTPPLDWVMSGQVQAIAPTAPVDGKLSSNVTIRLSGLMSIGGVIVGLNQTPGGASFLERQGRVVPQGSGQPIPQVPGQVGPGGQIFSTIPGQVGPTT
jgi:hypothetical protein